MIFQRSLCFLVVVLQSLKVSHGFHVQQMSSRVTLVAGPLHVGIAWDWNDQDLDETFLMQRAQACADSDSCSLDDARTCLDDVLHIQSGCVTGAVAGNICDNVDGVIEVVAKLRQKISAKATEAIVMTTGTNLVAVSLTLVVLAALASGISAVHLDSSPFTLQEVWWSIRDGYFFQLVSHYIRHGGLATMDYDTETTSFSLQEWWWAVKGGYISTMADHYFRNGGLATAPGSLPESASLTLQEWTKALKDGYIDQMILHNFKHAGLASIETRGLEAIAATPRELYWAARDGYAREFVDHLFRNGGI